MERIPILSVEPFLGLSNDLCSLFARVHIKASSVAGSEVSSPEVQD